MLVPFSKLTITSLLSGREKFHASCAAGLDVRAKRRVEADARRASGETVIPIRVPVEAQVLRGGQFTQSSVRLVSEAVQFSTIHMESE